jgi:hemerythrin-like metal-binding protein
MPHLEWSDRLALGLEPMDQTHREFVDLLAVVAAAPDAGLLAAWCTLVDHTDAHFGQEDRWMQDAGFSAVNCHSRQHAMVLEVLREGVRRGEAGDLTAIREMAAELAVWFPQHAEAMDAALAEQLAAVGYDTTTGTLRTPEALPAEPISGCGGATCSPHSAAAPSSEPATA